MVRVIVNEGQGPRAHELSDRLTVGSTPDCDIALADASASGCQIVIEATPTGHKCVRLTGDAWHNEQPFDVVHLLHGDTLRLGHSMVLYKNPEATVPVEAPVEDLLQEEEAVEEEGESDGDLLEELEDEIDLEPEPAQEPEPEPAPAPTPEPDGLDGPDEPQPEIDLEFEPAPEPRPRRAVQTRPLKVRFVRPLPPGRRPPAGPPPPHPPSPPRSGRPAADP